MILIKKFKIEKYYFYKRMKLYWNKPYKLKSGNYVINAYIQDENINEFWKIWNIKKKEIKEKNFSLKKYNQKWQISYWFKDNDIEKVYHKINELCKEFGFIETKKNNDKLLVLPNEIIKKIIEYIYHSDDEICKNGIKIACKKTYQIYKEIHNNDIYNKTNDYIKEIFEFLLIFQKSLYIDFLRKEIIIHYDHSDKPRIYFISYNNNRKALHLRYRPDWDTQRFAVSSEEYDSCGKLKDNKKQKEEGFSCIFYQDWVYEKIEHMIYILKKNRIYNNAITVYDLDESEAIINNINNLKKLEKINKYTKIKIYMIIVLLLNFVLTEL